MPAGACTLPGPIIKNHSLFRLFTSLQSLRAKTFRVGFGGTLRKGKDIFACIRGRNGRLKAWVWDIPTAFLYLLGILVCENGSGTYGVIPGLEKKRTSCWT